MDDRLDPEQVAAEADADRLWRALLMAKQTTDHQLARAIESRMRELQIERRFAHLTDEQLQARIDGISAHREPEDMLSYSPGGGSEAGAWAGPGDISALNRGIKTNQHNNIEATLGALLDELRRRRG